MRARDWLASLLASVLAGALAAGCHGREEHVPGDAGAGRAAIERHQCGACHVIPGIVDARGDVGPPLTDYGRRVYLAGKFPQDPALLERWIRDAPSLEPRTAMPGTDVTEREARDIAAYLRQLR
jgi:cytochrome c